MGTFSTHIRITSRTQCVIQRIGKATKEQLEQRVHKIDFSRPFSIWIFDPCQGNRWSISIPHDWKSRLPYVHLRFTQQFTTKRYEILITRFRQSEYLSGQLLTPDKIQSKGKFKVECERKSKRNPRIKIHSILNYYY